MFSEKNASLLKKNESFSKLVLKAVLDNPEINPHKFTEAFKAILQKSGASQQSFVFRGGERQKGFFGVCCEHISKFKKTLFFR